ncbi:MAG: hypothetical protein HGA87_00790 [Desulfobulbaceae bacterium]|nr:hypothetical protein [Desulfobulbaceae bacterium]
MEAISLLALCDAIYTAIPYALCIGAFGLLLWLLAPYMAGGNNENDYL